MKINCFFGFHRWGDWLYAPNWFAKGKYPDQHQSGYERECRDCNSGQTQIRFYEEHRLIRKQTINWSR